MKTMKLFMAVVAILGMSIFSSCSETPEEKFLTELEEFVEKVEKVNYVSDVKALGFYNAETLTSKFQEIYDEESELKFSDKQKEEYAALIGRLEAAIEKASNLLAEEAEEDDEDSEVEEDTYSYESSSDSEDWDALLDSYEEYVDKYISLLKKASEGDMSALSEYPALMEKAQEFSDKMEDAEGDMSTSQWSRYMRITNKMSNAALSM